MDPRVTLDAAVPRAICNAWRAHRLCLRINAGPSRLGRCGAEAAAVAAYETAMLDHIAGRRPWPAHAALDGSPAAAGALQCSVCDCGMRLKRFTHPQQLQMSG